MVELAQDERIGGFPVFAEKLLQVHIVFPPVFARLGVRLLVVHMGLQGFPQQSWVLGGAAKGLGAARDGQLRYQVGEDLSLIHI